jgi:hypothetical protein
MSKMTATINDMEYVYADILTADQLMEDDLIEIIDEDGVPSIVEVKEIISLPTNYLLIAIDEFGETMEIELADDARVKLFILQ